jgi:hypothetical protein
MIFEINKKQKRLVFDSDLRGLKIRNIQYVAGQDGILIYDQINDLKADQVELQMSTNTSTLIPALRILSLPYNAYFDQKEVIESQNNISFYWNKSKLAAFYNKFSTDQLEYEEREPVITRAVNFLLKTSDKLPLKDEYLDKTLEPVKLLGFHKGFPIFDGASGFAKLQSRLGIHIDPETVMVSTPMDEYETDVYEMAESIAKESGLEYSKKKNRVVFPKTNNLLNLLLK